MPFTRQAIFPFFSMPPDPTDWTNLSVSGCTRVQLPYAIITVGLLGQLRANGVVRVVSRLTEDDYRTEGARAAIGARAALWRLLGVDTWIVGVEPEGGFDWRYGAPTWGQDDLGGKEAYLHTYRLDHMRAHLQSLGLTVVSAGWSDRGHYMNWERQVRNEGPQPGRQAWLEITRTAYDKCDANGFHWYSSDGTQYDLIERMQKGLWRGQGDHHRPLFIDEVGCNRGTQQARMLAILKLATLLLERDTTKPYGGAGARVEALVPFVGNGTGQGYDPGFIMRDPQCYVLLRQFIGGKDFT